MADSYTKLSAYMSQGTLDDNTYFATFNGPENGPFTNGVVKFSQIKGKIDLSDYYKSDYIDNNYYKKTEFIDTQNNPTTLIKQIMNFVYPIGSYYWSSDDTSPSVLFGGEWEQITNRFVFAAGDNYVVDSTGGEAAHQLTINEMPKHNHAFFPWFLNGSGNYPSPAPYGLGYQSAGEGKWHGSRFDYDKDAGTRIETTGGPAIQYRGEGTMHNNMPPYIVAYCWKRKQLFTPSQS